MSAAFSRYSSKSSYSQFSSSEECVCIFHEFVKGNLFSAEVTSGKV
ncbi:hypothetical protein T07_13021 [Trichinella nelsoni]|uniref:Uncharacterized protein n=1 Tax=Trichinella nelsoni TaxID=6336 RepID=A0A0V0RC82_9BILA|nr:hypothetical protein T07_13021 [Trichinella nelsoni]